MTLLGVSFVVPVYNKADCIEPVLRQIARQAGGFPRQFIFIDDGSTDGSLEIVQRLTACWPNVIIESQKNSGSANATNRGIALVDQPYIKFVDADDLLADQATLTLLQALDGSNACLAFGDAIRYKDEGEVDFSVWVESPEAVLLDKPLRRAIKSNLFIPSQSLARTDAVRAVGGCDQRVMHSQEYALTLRLAHRWPLMRVHAPVAFIPKSVKWRLSHDQAKQLQRGNRALAFFLRDHAEIPLELQRYACHRAAGRAWLFARRNKGASLFSPWYRRYLASCLGIRSDHVGFIEKCCDAFDDTNNLII